MLGARVELLLEILGALASSCNDSTLINSSKRGRFR